MSWLSVCLIWAFLIVYGLTCFTAGWKAHKENGNE